MEYDEVPKGSTEEEYVLSVIKYRAAHNKEELCSEEEAVVKELKRYLDDIVNNNSDK